MKFVSVLSLAFFFCTGLYAQITMQASEPIALKDGANNMYPSQSGSVWLLNTPTEAKKFSAALSDGQNSSILNFDLTTNRAKHTNFKLLSVNDGSLWLVSTLVDKKLKKIKYFAGTLNEDGTTGEVKEIWSTDPQNKMNDGFALYNFAKSPDGNLILLSTGTESAIFNSRFELQSAIGHDLNKLTEVLIPAIANNGDFAFIASTFESKVSMDGAQSFSVVHYSTSSDKIVSANLARFKISNMASRNEASIVSDDANNFIAIMAGHKNGLKAVVNEFSVVGISSKDQTVSANLHTVDVSRYAIDCTVYGSSIHDPITLQNGYVSFLYGSAAIWYLQVDPQLNVVTELTSANLIHPYYTVLGNGIQNGNSIEIFSNGNKDMIAKIVANKTSEFGLSDCKGGACIRTTCAPGETKKVELIDAKLPDDILFTEGSMQGVRTSKGTFFLAKKKLKPIVVSVK
jgi:hypothetical protein